MYEENEDASCWLYNYIPVNVAQFSLFYGINMVEHCHLIGTT